MLITPNEARTHHAVSSNPPTAENPLGYHRLIGGSVELGETLRDAIIREVDEELGADILKLAYLGTIESIFQLNREIGHEIVGLFTGTLAPEPAGAEATLTESDGSLVSVVWRPFEDTDQTVPLYPASARSWLPSCLPEHSQG